MMALFDTISWMVSHWYVMLALLAVGVAIAYMLLGRQLIDIARMIVKFAVETTIGRSIIAGLVILFFASVLVTAGRNYERNKCDAESVRQQLADERQKVAERDAAMAQLLDRLKQAQQSQSDDSERAALAEAKIKALEAKINEVTPATGKGPVRCLDPDTARRVLDIK